MEKMLERAHYIQLLQRYFKTHPIVAILGPRQCGKTTLAREYFKMSGPGLRANYFDLEDSTDLIRLSSPKATLNMLDGLIVIDEVQRQPELFPTLRVLVDEPSQTKKYLILGSASRELLQQSSESLAGRIAYIELTPLSFSETHVLQPLWYRGGFPKSYLAETDADSYDWRTFYVKTFLEQDLPNLGLSIPAETMRRFWSMMAHNHANLLNAAEIARSFGYSDTSVKRYLDILSATFMVRQLKPWYENLKKRQVKASKIYFRDSGLLHTLLGIHNEQELLVHPKMGASWEGFALEEVIRSLHTDPEDCYFWATHQQAELDLLICQGSEKHGFEFKYSDAPRLTRSMHIALADLNLTSLTVIYPGQVDYPLSDRIKVCGLISYLNTQA